MRGSPVLQSIVVLFVLAMLSFAGIRFIKTPEKPTAEENSAEKLATLTGDHSVELEIFFSETPVKYMLRRPNDNKAILSIDGFVSNPALHEYTLLDADDTVLWLDVTWPDKSIGKRNFIQVSVTIDEREPEVFTFHDVTKVLQGTMELAPLTDHEY